MPWQHKIGDGFGATNLKRIDCLNVFQSLSTVKHILLEKWLALHNQII